MPARGAGRREPDVEPASTRWRGPGARRSRRPVWSAFRPTPSTASAGWSRRPRGGRSRAPRDAPRQAAAGRLSDHRAAARRRGVVARGRRRRAPPAAGAVHTGRALPRRHDLSALRPRRMAGRRRAPQGPRRPSCGRWACACRRGHRRRAALGALPFPLLASSANPSGGQDPVGLADVAPGVRAACDLLLDAGSTSGVSSTVVDLSGLQAGRGFRVVRPGSVGIDEIAVMLAS